MKEYKAKRNSKRVRGFWLLPLVFALSFFSSRPAAADCEPGSDTGTYLSQIIQMDVYYINLWITQEANPQMVGPGPSPGGFIDNIIRTVYGEPPASNGIQQYYDTFWDTMMTALADFASKDLLKPSLTGLVQETHVSMVDQSYRIGQLMDSQLMAEEAARKGSLMNDAVRRYQPSEYACEIDSIGPGLAQSYEISRAVNSGFAYDDAPRHENSINNQSVKAPGPSISANGKAAEINATWNEYKQLFCDNTMGDQGCAAPGTLAGKEKDIGALLWGPQQTIDPTNPSNIKIMQSALRYVIDPLVSDPVPQTAVDSTAGHDALMIRHAELAFTNTIYNTLGAMLSERVGGSGIDAQQMEAAAGVPPEDTLPSGTAGASYRELQEVITRDRFNNPAYLVHLLGNTDQVAREQMTLDAIRLQTMNDTFHRLEERLFMESAEYGVDLNSQMPRAAARVMPMK